VLVIIALILIFGLMLLWIFNRHILDPLPNQEFYLLVMIIIILYLVTAKVYSTNNMIAIHKALGFHKTNGKFILLAIALAMFIWFFDYFYQIKILNIDVNAQAIDWYKGQKNLTATLFSTVIFAPIVEEMLFRGIFQQTINKYLNQFWTAIILSALFSALHASFIESPSMLTTLLNYAWQIFIENASLFIAAIFYAWLTFKSKSIIPAILAHILNNCLTFYYYVFLLN
jgi:membrane protease YdiL (CAAX protease family)